MSVLLEGDAVISDEDAKWSGIWQFAKDKKVGVSFNYQWVSCSLPRDLLDYVSFVPSPNDPIPLPIQAVSHSAGSGRGRGRGRGRMSASGGRGVHRVSRCGRISSSSSLSAGDDGVAGEHSSEQDLGEASAELEIEGIDGDVDLGEVDLEKLGEGGELGYSKSADGYNDSDVTDSGSVGGSVEDAVNTAVEGALSSETTTAADDGDAGDGDAVSMDVCDDDSAAAEESTAPRSVTPVVIEREHPLFGLWTGSFDVRGLNGVLDKVEECFFFHSYMNQEPCDDLIDLPQEPQFTSLILRRKKALGLTPRSSITSISSDAGAPPAAPSNTSLPTPISASISTEGAAAAGGGAGGSLGKALLTLNNPEGEASSSPASSSSSSSSHVSGGQGAMKALGALGTLGGIGGLAGVGGLGSGGHGLGLGLELSLVGDQIVGEPNTKYIVGFGRNPFGRFSLTASLNEITGRMRCEKKYITSKGSGRRGRRPGSTFGPSRLSIDSTGSEHPDGPGTLGTSGASSVRAMSTRPRKPLPDTSFFFPSSYDEAAQGAAGPHLKKRKSAVFEDADGVKPKAGSHQKGPPGSTPTMSAVQAHREKEREKDRERAREKEREMEIERELDDSNSDYRVAYLDDESGEIYEGGWNPHTQRRQGQGICLYTDGTLYEGGWVSGREGGKGQMMTGERNIIYTGEWVDGTMTGHGTYHFNNGDRYTGDWREGIRHGKGEYIMSNGCSYIGDWKNNKRTGSGVFQWADGSTYDGDWENDSRHGRGLLALANGFRYDGQWFHNYMEGRGVSVFPGGQEYQGSYKAGLREGRGSIKFAHGAVYEGRFRDDKIDGQGTIVVTETMPGAEEGEILIPIQIQADIRRIHLKAGFGADAAH